MSIQKQESLTGRFLVAMPNLSESEFDKSIIYMLEHGSKGAVGLVINKPMTISVDEILVQVDDNYADYRHPQVALSGGPVEKGRGFILHENHGTKRWQGETDMGQGISVTTSADIMHALVAGEVEQGFILVLGYAGWSPGQLEQELLENSWLIVEASADIIFKHKLEQRYDAVLAQLGIEYHQLSNISGSA